MSPDCTTAEHTGPSERGSGVQRARADCCSKVWVGRNRMIGRVARLAVSGDNEGGHSCPGCRATRIESRSCARKAKKRRLPETRHGCTARLNREPPPGIMTPRRRPDKFGDRPKPVLVEIGLLFNLLDHGRRPIEQWKAQRLRRRVTPYRLFRPVSPDGDAALPTTLGQRRAAACRWKTSLSSRSLRRQLHGENRIPVTPPSLDSVRPR